MKTRLAAWPMAVAVRYATRRILKRVTTSAEVADNWVVASVVVVLLVSSNVWLLIGSVINLAAALRHCKNIEKGE